MKNNCKNGNPKKRSEFICLSCGRIIMDGIQRPRQREKDHIKDLFCVFEGKDVKSIEVRWCNSVIEIYYREKKQCTDQENRENGQQI